MDIVDFVSGLTSKVVAIAWAIFLLTWSIGWVLRGAPLPSLRLKRTGQSLIEDAVWAAFWLAIGTTVFAAVQYVAGMLASQVPSSNITMIGG